MANKYGFEEIAHVSNFCATYDSVSLPIVSLEKGKA